MGYARGLGGRKSRKGVQGQSPSGGSGKLKHKDKFGHGLEGHGTTVVNFSVES